jgi:hypothetical protein
VVWPLVPIKVADCPLSVFAPKVAEQELAPTFQLKLVPTAQGAAATGTVQLEPVAAPQLPSVHIALAVPTVGVVVSEKLAVWPESVIPPAGKALQVPPVPVQLRLAEQESAGLQSIAVTVDMPLLHVKLAVPVFGLVLSIIVIVVPCACAKLVAVHAPQLYDPGLQAEGCVHVAFVAAAKAPVAVQANVAVPVVEVDALLYVTMVELPCLVDDATALHILLVPQVTLPEQGVSVVRPVDEVEQAAPVLPVTPVVPGAAKQLSNLLAFM